LYVNSLIIIGGCINAHKTAHEDIMIEEEGDTDDECETDVAPDSGDDGDDDDGGDDGDGGDEKQQVRRGGTGGEERRNGS
jgi:hypothetical protein